MQKKTDSVTLRVENGRAVCPVCGRETQQTILNSTVLVDFQLFCKRCKQVTKVEYRKPEPESLSD